VEIWSDIARLDLSFETMSLSPMRGSIRCVLVWNIVEFQLVTLIMRINSHLQTQHVAWMKCNGIRGVWPDRAQQVRFLRMNATPHLGQIAAAALKQPFIKTEKTFISH
jgi:hypothetical protein